MGGGTTRRLVAGGVLLACLIALPGQAGAGDAPSVSIADVAAAEGNSGTEVVKLTVTRGPSPEESTVQATVSGNSTESEDYTAVPIQVLTFPPAAEASTQDVVVTFNGDTVYEDDETFTVTLSALTNATVARGVAEGKIENDDGPPAATITGPGSDVTEGSPVSFKITLAAKAERAVDVQYRTQDGTAKAGEDYAGANTSVPFAAGDLEKTITVETPIEALDEDERETFSVVLPSSGSAATATIVDNDDPPSVAEVFDVEVPEADATANLRVTLSGPSGRAITIDYGLAEGGTATAGSDFVSPSGKLQIPAGSTEGFIPVTIKQDTLFEADETVLVNLFGHVNVTPGRPENVQGKVTIKDDGDAAAAPTVPSASGAEGNSGLTDLTFSVTLPSPRPQTTFNYRTIAGSADGSDFTEVGGAPLVFPANSSNTPTTLPVTIKVKGDLLDEEDETFTLELRNPTTGALVRAATGTIANDDNNTKISISDATADEPSTGAAALKFTVTLSVASGRNVGVDWATADGTATAGVDYTAAGGTLAFAPGETSKTVEVTVIGDTVNEENETLKVTLAAPTGVPAANLVDAQGDGTIIDKNAPPTLSISDPLARESEGAKFTVTLAGTTLRTVTVRFSTADGGGKAGSDYASRVGSLTFAPGEKTKTIEVTVLDDAVSEPNEDFFVVLDDAVNATITKGRGRASIEASDQVAAPPTPPVTPPKTPVVGKPTTVLVPRMILGPRTVSVGPNGIARMLVTCQKASPIGCAGSVELQRAGKPLLRLGKRAFSVKKGAKGYASIKLTTRGLAALRKNRTLRAKVVVIVKTSAKSMKVSPGIIVLKTVETVAKPKPKPPTTTKVVVDP